MNEKYKSLKNLILKMFPDDTMVKEQIESKYFDLSQDIIKLESKNKMGQRETADFLKMPLTDFLDFESGYSHDDEKYKEIKDKLKSHLSNSYQVLNNLNTHGFDYLDPNTDGETYIVETTKNLINNNTNKPGQQNNVIPFILDGKIVRKSVDKVEYTDTLTNREISYV